MRKLIVAAATAATVSTLGLTATAQALSVSQGAGRATAAVSKTVVAGIPAAFTIVQASTTKCVWKTTGLPGPVTSGIGGKNNCTNLIDGVFPKPGTVKITAKVTHGGKVTTIPISVTVRPSPGEKDAVGVGSDTITPLTDQLAGDYNTTVSAAASHEYSWDAVNPISGKIGDAITWATQTVTAAPKTLTPAQLSAIFTCADTNWSQVGGKNAPIKAFLPQAGSGTLSFWETALGITPGPCVSDAGNTLEENEGVNPVLNNPGTIFIY